MTAVEADSLLERVRRGAEAAGDPVAPDLLESLREVTRDDDGREFIMVNLIKYRRKAVYPPGFSYGDKPQEADARYNRAVVPLLLKRACLPHFPGTIGESIPGSRRDRRLGLCRSCPLPEPTRPAWHFRGLRTSTGWSPK